MKEPSQNRIGAKVGNWRSSASAFVQLNVGWNADPNAPEPEVVVGDRFVELWVWPNRYLYPDYVDKGRIRIAFEGCTKYRMTAVYDHSRFDGKCRFSDVVPNWGDFYEITGDTRDDEDRTPWVECVNEGSRGADRHFHFYLRDGVFECKAKGGHLNGPLSHGNGEIDDV